MSKNRIKELRIRNSLSLKELCSTLNIHRDTLSNYESGITDIPSTIAIEIAKYFNVSLDYLLKINDDLIYINSNSLSDIISKNNEVLQKEIISNCVLSKKNNK